MNNLHPAHRSVRSASLFSSYVAALFSGLLILWFHSNRAFTEALPLAMFYSLFCAALVMYLTSRVARKRLGIAQPVVGALRGSLLGVATFVIAVIVHTIFFPGMGGFFVSIFPILLIGLGMFGWVVAIIGALVGAFCERRYFA